MEAAVQLHVGRAVFDPASAVVASLSVVELGATEFERRRMQQRRTIAALHGLENRLGLRTLRWRARGKWARWSIRRLGRWERASEHCSPPSLDAGGGAEPRWPACEPQ